MLPYIISSPEDISNYRNDILRLTTSRNSFFICGDFNSRHCSTANQAGNALFTCEGLFSVHFPPTPTRIPRISHQRPSTLYLVLTNGFHEVCDLSTRAALSSHHLPVLFGVELNVRREVPEHFVFNYKNADWALFRREMDSRMADVASMIWTFTEAILETRAAAVLFVRPSRFYLTLFPQIKSIIAQRNGWWRVWQNSRNTQNRLEFETLNNLVRDRCRGLSNTAFGNNA
jgi:hypothetical protein